MTANPDSALRQDEAVRDALAKLKTINAGTIREGYVDTIAAHIAGLESALSPAADRDALADNISAFIAAIAEGVTNGEATRAIMVSVDGYVAALRSAAGPYLIWSNEHRMWWAPNRQSYTPHLEEAGRYSRDEAIGIAQRATFGWREGAPPNEIAIAEADAIASLTPPA